MKKYKIKFTINSAHSEEITSVKYYCDKLNKIHYLISSAKDKSIKLWNIINKYMNTLTIKDAASNKWWYPLFMIFSNNKTLIGSSGNKERIKIYNFSGSKLESIYCDYDINWHSEIYYINDKIYILMSCRPGIRLYDYLSKTTKFKLISNNNKNIDHVYSIIENVNNETIIFDADESGFITLWNFNSGEMIKSIITKGFHHKGIATLCIWNSSYLITGGKDMALNLFNLKSFKQVKSYPAHSKPIMKIRKFKSKNEGETLISVGEDNKIYLWK